MGWQGIGALRVAGVAAPQPPGALIQGTPRFADGDILAYHADGPGDERFDVRCFLLPDAVVTAEGRIWVDGALLTGREFMPAYVLHLVQGVALPELHRARELPVRVIEEPTIVLVGHGLSVYGHFLIEMLFRVLVLRRALGDDWATVRFLLDRSAPPWLVTILTEGLGVPASGIASFDGRTERVQLRRGIVAGNVGGSHEGFHPVCKDLIDELLADLALPRSRTPSPDRVFLVRRDFENPNAPHRRCLNESELIERARRRHHFVAVTMEKLHWRDQIALARGARVMVGPWGSALHAALFSGPGARVASVGCLNRVQSNIAALRGLGMGYLTRGVPQYGDFTVDPLDFDAFLDAVCVGSAPCPISRSAP